MITQKELPVYALELNVVKKTKLKLNLTLSVLNSTFSLLLKAISYFNVSSDYLVIHQDNITQLIALFISYYPSPDDVLVLV